MRRGSLRYVTRELAFDCGLCSLVLCCVAIVATHAGGDGRGAEVGELNESVVHHAAKGG